MGTTIEKRIFLILFVCNCSFISFTYGKVCWMLYLMADNDLESFIRQDFYELSISSVVRQTNSLTTWVYFDHRNYNNNNVNNNNPTQQQQQQQQPLPNIVHPNGSPVTVGTSLSQYLKWSSRYNAFVVEQTLPQEQNGDDPETVYNFIRTALQDCISTSSSSNDNIELFVEFASHGAGFLGFGGDEDPGRRRLKRQLLQQQQQQQQQQNRQLEWQTIPTTTNHFQNSSLTANTSNETVSLLLSSSDSHQNTQQQQIQEQQQQQRHRHLVQTNAQLVGALKRALQNTPGSPSQYDVIGFDACYMQAVGVADDFSSITKYILASEAVEPGHGWSYNPLKNGNTAIDLAKDIHYNFLNQLQGYSYHLTPKTLSIVDTTKFVIFLSAWDTLCAIMKQGLENNNNNNNNNNNINNIFNKNNNNNNQDSTLLTQINRARNQAIMFASALDLEGTIRPSAVDIGSFLEQLQTACVPKTNDDTNNNNNIFAQQLQTTIDLYNNMFLEQGVGEGTVPATGMHIIWPVRSEYWADEDFFNNVLFESNVYAIQTAPNWIAFLKTYYRSTVVSSTSSSDQTTTTSSVCTAGVLSSVAPLRPGQLIIQPTLSNIQNDGHYFDTEIAQETDWMLVEYGIDLTPLLHQPRQEQRGRGRRNMRKLSSSSSSSSSWVMQQKSMPVEEWNPFAESSNNHNRRGPYTKSLDMASTTTTTTDDNNNNKGQSNRSFRRELQSHRHRNPTNQEEEQQQQHSRTLQQRKDYFILFGGDVAGNYNQSKYDAFWDRQFYLFEDSNGENSGDVLYVFDNGNGQKEVPVIYIPNNNNHPNSRVVTPDDLYFGLSEQEAIKEFGGQYGYLSFSLDNLQAGKRIPDVLLYTSDGSTYSETPREAGGQILPIVYVDGQLNNGNLYLNVLIGGFFSTIIEWNTSNRITLFVMSASEYLELFNVDYLVMDILAIDDDKTTANAAAAADGSSSTSSPDDDGYDFASFNIDRNGNTFQNDAGNASSAGRSATNTFLIGAVSYNNNNIYIYVVVALVTFAITLT